MLSTPVLAAIITSASLTFVLLICGLTFYFIRRKTKRIERVRGAAPGTQADLEKYAAEHEASFVIATQPAFRVAAAETVERYHASAGKRVSVPRGFAVGATAYVWLDGEGARVNGKGEVQDGKKDVVDDEKTEVAKAGDVKGLGPDGEEELNFGINLSSWPYNTW